MAVVHKKKVEATGIGESGESETGKAQSGRAVKGGKGGSGKNGSGVKVAGVKRKTVAELVEVAALIAGAMRKRKRRSNKDGAEMMKQAADQALVEITGAVVSKLSDKAKEGNVVCVKTLMLFSERKKPRAERKKRFVSWAEQLAKEPEWVGPPDYGDAEVVDEDDDDQDPGVEPGAPFGPIR